MRRPIRSDSSSEVPGSVTALIVSEPSLNSGRNARPRNGSTTMATARSPPDAPMTIHGCRSAPRSTGRYPFLSHLTRKLSPCASTRARGNRYAHIAGVSMSATRSDAKIAMRYANPSG